MQKQLLILWLLLKVFCSNAQEKALITVDSGVKDTELQTVLYFEGINFDKVKIQSPNIKGKNYQILVKEFVNGSLNKNEIVFNSTEDEYFRIKDNNLLFAALTKMSDNSEFKISFQFNGFSVSRRYGVPTSERNKFTLKSFFFKETEISIDSAAKNYIFAYMMPYVRKDKSEAYCEVAQSGIDPERLYEKYKIPHYYLIELKFLK